MASTRPIPPPRIYWMEGLICLFLTIAMAFGLRMLEWPAWQNPEYRLGNEMLLATHDAYHWVAGAVGYGRAVDHPMAVMLRLMAEATNVPAATIAFWFPAVLASLVAGIVCLWVWAMGSLQAGIAAGLIASIAPGFLGRTLLGYYDTDLVTLFFPLLIALAPACWAMRFMLLPRQILARSGRAGVSTLYKFFSLPSKNRKQLFTINLPPARPLAWQWLALLAISGLVSWWTQEWHSVFPYIIRYNSALLGLMALLLAPAGRKRLLLLGASAYCLPALAGPCGLLAPLCLIPVSLARKKRLTAIFASSWLVGLLWLVIIYFLARGEIFNTLLNHINAYLKHTGDIHSSGTIALVFPSVAQSIIEVQDLSFAALFPYFHPWLEASLLGFLCFGLVIFRRPGALFLLPLAALGILSSKLGGRMVMFGAPIAAIGISLACYWLVFLLFRRRHPTFCGWVAFFTLCGLLVAPFLDMIPALSQGPIINRRHAAALAQARDITPPDACLWLWWDWGYAAHYFSRRQTIADGAEHGGPSLYLPAAVFATDNPRFARQLIRQTSLHENRPGSFFEGMNADTAQEFINRLRSADTPLVRGKGRQFVIVSFEMLKLGFWISNFGNWNFITRQGEGGAISIVPQSLAYRLNAGEVRLSGSPSIIFPSSISVFEETGVTQRNYIQQWFDTHPRATPQEQKNFLATRRNINFLFNRVTDEKLAVDQGIYSSLMTQLLLCGPHDPRFAPYFKLVYDNVFARIYEVLPEEN